jgi:hypothetical protein
VSESPSEGQPIEGQADDSQHANGQPAESQTAGERPSEPVSEPVSERYSDWRTDGSGGRFTEPPPRPAEDLVGKPVSYRPSKPSGARDSRPSGERDSKPSGDRSAKSSSDPVGDMQRWLMKAGARSMANQVANNVRRSLNQPKRDKGKGDVWDTATTELPPDEPPECQWCPVCQAARRMRVSGPGIGDRLASVGGVFASVVQDAFSAVDKAMKTAPPEDGPQDKAS